MANWRARQAEELPWLDSRRNVLKQFRSLPRADLPVVAAVFTHLADVEYVGRPELMRRHARLLALLCEAVLDGSHPGALVNQYDEIEAALNSENPVDLLTAVVAAEADIGENAVEAFLRGDA